MIGRMPNSQCRKPETCALAAIRSAGGIERVRRGHGAEHGARICKRFPQYTTISSFVFAGLGPPVSQRSGGVFFSFVEEGEFPQATCFTCSPNVRASLKAPSVGLNAVLVGGHRLGKPDKRSLDHREPLGHGGRHRIDVICAAARAGHQTGLTANTAARRWPSDGAARRAMG